MQNAKVHATDPIPNASKVTLSWKVKNVFLTLTDSLNIIQTVLVKSNVLMVARTATILYVIAR